MRRTIRLKKLKKDVIWAVPVALAAAGLFIAVSSHDQQLAERSIFVMAASCGLANWDSLVRWF